MKRRGQIIHLDTQELTVRVGRAGCERCEAGHGCGAGLFNRLLAPGYFDITLPLSVMAKQKFADQTEPDQLNVGQWLNLFIDERLMLQLALRVYGLTLLAFLVVAGLAFGLAQLWLQGFWLDIVVLLSGLLAAGLLWQRFAAMPHLKTEDLVTVVSGMGSCQRQSSMSR
jgi:positive regulator of sigma E activity